MKTLTFLILFSIIPFILSAQWYPQNSGTTEHLSSIHFTDTLNGCTVGYNGTILNTSDGGNNWEEQISGTNNNLLSIYFTDTNHGWAGGVTDNWPYVGLLLRTVDGGFNWEELDFEMGAVRDIFFMDSLTGWALGYDILHTTDGGETWEISFEPPNFIITRSICFTDSLNGWVSGGHMIGSTGHVYGYIWHTNDGGNNWENQFYYGEHDGTILYSIYFVDSLNGWCAGGSWGFYGILLKTSNGGTDWDTSYYASYNSEELKSVNFTDLYNGWAVGQDGLIISTSDGGNTWDTMPGGTTQYLMEVYFTESGHGWIAGTGGTILHADYSQIVGLDEFESQNPITSVRCFPNPFSTSTIIEYELKQTRSVQITIYNHLGEQMELIQQIQSAGKQQLFWNANRFPSGIYFCKLKTNPPAGGQTIKIIKL